MPPFVPGIVPGTSWVCPWDTRGIVPGTNWVCPWDKPGFAGLPLCKIRRKPRCVPGFHRICPRDKPGEIPGTNPGSSQGQPDKTSLCLCAFFLPETPPRHILFTGSRHPSPTIKTLCSFKPQKRLELITSRHATSACFPSPAPEQRKSKRSETSTKIWAAGIRHLMGKTFCNFKPQKKKHG